MLKKYFSNHYIPHINDPLMIHVNTTLIKLNMSQYNNFTTFQNFYIEMQNSDINSTRTDSWHYIPNDVLSRQDQRMTKWISFDETIRSGWCHFIYQVCCYIATNEVEDLIASYRIIVEKNPKQMKRSIQCSIPKGHLSFLITVGCIISLIL